MIAEAKPAAGDGGHREFVATDWKPMEKNTLRGFVTIVLPSGVRIREVHRARARPPALGQHPIKGMDQERREHELIPLVDFTSKQARDRFQQLALAAIDKLLGGVR
jgi:hypothetical protein